MTRLRRLLAIFAVVALVWLPAASTARSDQTAASATSAPLLRLEPLRVRDPNAGGLEAFRMLVPKGWSARGGMLWNLRYNNLASVVMKIQSPDRRRALESFALYPAVWQDGGIPGFPVGSVYLGSEVRPPMSALSFLTQVIVPNLRGGVGARIVRQQRLPRVASVAGGVTKSSFDAARVRVVYREAGRSVEETFYTLLSYTRSPIVRGALLWRPEYLYSFKAPAGRLDRESPTLQACVGAFRFNLKWYAAYRYVFQLWVDGQYQAIRSAGVISRAVSQANDAISASIRSSYESSQRSYDRVSQSFGDQIRGVGTYENPFDGRTVQLPSDYGDVWVSSRGEYVLSDDPNFDPNAGSGGDFRRLQPRG